eukprot:scaffold156400_cov22-Tisochrysis_lutea.AAC.1
MKSRKTQTPPPPRKCSKHATDSDASRLVACKNSGSTSKASGSGSMQKQWQWQWQWQWQHARTVAVSCKSSVMKVMQEQRVHVLARMLVLSVLLETCNICCKWPNPVHTVARAEGYSTPPLQCCTPHGVAV